MKLEEHPLIQSLVAARRDSILQEIELIDIAPGTLIFEENSEPDALFLILEGGIAFTKMSEEGQRQQISESGPGSFFGEVGVFTGERRALDAVAIHPGQIARVPAQTAKRMIEDSEPVKKILENVTHHLKSTTAHYVDEVTRTQKLALVGTMVSSILHDFKNPFSVICLGAQLIRNRYPDDSKTIKICENMEAQIRRMVSMVNDLAAYSQGRYEIEIASVSFKQLFEQFRELNSHFFEDKTIEIILLDKGAMIQGDANRLLRVLQNLIGNAIDALHAVEIEGTVEVVACEEGDAVVLTVSDDGPGIPEQIRETFFEPFVTFGKDEGTGLGSAIVKSIVEAHRGSICFTTSAEGTTFTLRLPKFPQTGAELGANKASAQFKFEDQVPKPLSK